MTPWHLSPDWSSGTESKSNGSQGQASILMHGRLRRPEAIDVARIPPQELREESIVIHVFQLDNTHDSHETNMCVGDRHINHGFNPCHHCHLPPPLFHVVFPPSPSLFCPILSSPMSLICPSVPVNAATANMFRQKATEASRILFEFDVNLEVWFEHLHRNWDGIAFTVELSCDLHWHRFKWMDGMGVRLRQLSQGLSVVVGVRWRWGWLPIYLHLSCASWNLIEELPTLPPASRQRLEQARTL